MTAKKKPTRAELIRQQREKRPRKRPAKSARRSQKSSSGSLPPILVRGGVAAAASRSQRKAKNNRRRYDIALNSQGAEMRLPSIPSIGVGWRLLSAFLIGALGFAIYTIWFSPMFTVDKIDVSGMVRLTNAEINSVANVIGKSIILVDPTVLEANLGEAFPELVGISVETEVPNKVRISFVERQPVLAWQQDGQTYWVDENGYAYAPSGEVGPGITVQGSELLATKPDVSDTLEEGEKTDQTLPVELVNAILAVSSEVPENTPIVYDAQHGIGWLDPRGWQVFFGSTDEDIELKLKVYEKTFRRLKKAGIRPELISVEYVHAPYYRLER
ncbi:MAG: FtsQ-type POTRA domain-containing protein [Chloroflexota bacterium]|nr:MAG: FtsQ-type POTRA domain-containing protein [Chloroflexota bacterium]